jgi:hypothetical protein
MVSAELFEFLDTVLRQIRHSHKPFGGIQLVLSGDFFQLPPVSRSVKDGGVTPGAFLNRGYAFQAPAWRKADLWTVKLTEVFRQTDPAFVCLLNNVRYGDARAAEWLFKLTSAPFREGANIQPTRLFARNADVDRVNAEELAKLEGSSAKFQAVDRVTDVAGDPVGRRRLYALCNEGMAQRTLVLKAGAQVMLVKNYMGLVNGSCGVVETFVPLSDFLARDRAVRGAAARRWLLYQAAELPAEPAPLAPLPCPDAGDATLQLHVLGVGHLVDPGRAVCVWPPRDVRARGFRGGAGGRGAELPRAGAPQAGLGADHPQVPGHVAGPGGRLPGKVLCRRAGLRGAEPGAVPGRPARERLGRDLRQDVACRHRLCQRRGPGQR